MIVNLQPGHRGLDKAPNAAPVNSFYTQSLKELKKNDLFDLGVVLLLCAASGFDMVSEEYLERLCDYSMQCCVIHAIQDINPSQEGFDSNLLTTLITLRKIFDRLSEECIEFICLCIQQRFTDGELQAHQ